MRAVTLIRQTYRKIRVASADGAYDTRRCHDELRRKKIKALIPPRTRAGYWPAEYADRNQAVARQRLTGSNAYWKWHTARTFQPFVAADWVYNTRQAGVSMNGASDNITGSRNVVELKAGVEGRLSSNLSLWTNVAQQMGGNGYSDTQGTLGLKVDF